MLLQGLGPTAAGYSIQGGLKYGVYELLKSVAATATGVPTGARSRNLCTKQYRLLFIAGQTEKSWPLDALPLGTHLALSMLLLLAAASEFVGSTALCPYEAARIRLVVEPNFATGARAESTHPLTHPPTPSTRADPTARSVSAVAATRGRSNREVVCHT